MKHFARERMSGKYSMRTRHSILCGLAAVAAVLLLAPGKAAADEYPWCAQYTGADSGRNCGFVSEAQCMQTVRGMGGFCERNLFYAGPAERPARPARRRRDN